jgi:hypothetical protein
MNSLVENLECQYFKQTISEHKILKAIDFIIEGRSLLVKCNSEDQAHAIARKTFIPLFRLRQQYPLNVDFVSYQWGSGKLERSLLDNRRFGLKPSGRNGLRG